MKTTLKNTGAKTNGKKIDYFETYRRMPADLKSSYPVETLRARINEEKSKNKEKK